MSVFKLNSEFAPSGDQPQAIEGIVKAFQNGAKYALLEGVTGSGKTFTMANVIAKLGIPALIMTHNKSLAAQLFSEFRGFFRKITRSISSATTTTTSQKPTSRDKTFSSKKTAR